MGNLYHGCRCFILAVVFLIPSVSFSQSVPPTISNGPAKYQVFNYPAQNIVQMIWSRAVTVAEVPGLFAEHCAAIVAASGLPIHTPQTSTTGTGWCFLNQGGWRVDIAVMMGNPVCETGSWIGGNYPNALCSNQRSCPANYVYNAATDLCDPEHVCPPNTVWNPVSQTCRCDNGSDVGDDGTCCPQASEALAQMQKCEVYSTAATSCQSSNANGCAIRCNKVQFQVPPNISGSEAVQITDGIPALGEMCKYTGSKANAIDRLGSPLENDEHAREDDLTKPKPPPKTPEGCMAAGMGYVTSSTGSTTCVKAGSAGTIKENSAGSGSESGTGPNGPKPGTTTESSKATAKGPGGQTSSKETTTTTNADGTKTVKTTETKCINGKCESTVTTETKDQNGNVIDSDQKKESGDKDSFCLKNPNDVACKKADSKFGGDCESGFTCEGDAATCGIAQASWRLACNSQQRGDLNDIGDGVIAGSDGKTVADVPTLHVALQQLPSDGPGGACPALPPLPGGYVVDMDQHCGILQGLGNAGVALALLMAGFIVVGGVRGL